MTSGSHEVTRRRFLQGAAVAALISMPATWRAAAAAPRSSTLRLGPADANGVRTLPGFRSRVVAVTGEPPTPSALYAWHEAPDGGAVFGQPDGGWIYVSNSETLPGGVGALRFDLTGQLVDAYPILTGSQDNCAGGATPWGTWLSCEEVAGGLVWECDPTGVRPAVAHPRMGTFVHEAAAVDTATGHVYMTEDHPSGCFYRYVPDTPGVLALGRLEVAIVAADGAVSWAPVPFPNPVRPQPPVRNQVAGSTRFDGGEGCFFSGGVVYLTTKGDNRVWAYDCAAHRLSVIYDDDWYATPVLRGVDNVTVSPWNQIVVAEDGDDLQLCWVRSGDVVPIAQVVGHDGSELTGPAFTPDGTRLYFSSQRPGATFEISGPFRALR